MPAEDGTDTAHVAEEGLAEVPETAPRLAARAPRDIGGHAQRALGVGLLAGAHEEGGYDGSDDAAAGQDQRVDYPAPVKPPVTETPRVRAETTAPT
jgi:hypothetical protein